MQLYPRANCLDVETALRMWTEKVTWFSNEEGKKGRIEKGQFADLVVPDKDFFACSVDEISFLTSDLTMVGGKIVYGLVTSRRWMKATCRPPCRTGLPFVSSVATPTGAGRKVRVNRHCAAPPLSRAIAPVIAVFTAIITQARGRRNCRLPISRGSSGRLGARAGLCESSWGSASDRFAFHNYRKRNEIGNIDAIVDRNVLAHQMIQGCFR